MSAESASGAELVRTAEVVATLSLATDLGTGLPMEHGLHSTLVAVRLADRLGADRRTASQSYYGALLFYVGCTADAELSAALFEDGALMRHFNPVIFGTPTETARGVMRALADSPGSSPRRILRAATRLPRAIAGHRQHVTALCEVAQMLSDRLGLPTDVTGLWPQLTARWDGKGDTADVGGEDIAPAMRIIHVARDAALQALIGGPDHAASVVRERSGAAFDPDVADMFADDPVGLLALDDPASVWDETLAAEPAPVLTLRDEAIDQALAAMGDFADLASPFLVGHSAGVADLAAAAAEKSGLAPSEARALRRSAHVHDLGRVATSAGVWQKPGALSRDEWEQVRLHAYHTERVLCRSPTMAALAAVASRHHERLDGSGYHRAATSPSLSPAARLLAAADVYHAMTEPRPHRDRHRPTDAANEVRDLAADGRLDAEAVSAVLRAAGHPEPRLPRLPRPYGLTEREALVLGLLARGLQTKQVARLLGISAKTADRHVQNAYAKIGVSTRAAAALFAMQHGLVAWGDLPMARATEHS